VAGHRRHHSRYCRHHSRYCRHRRRSVRHHHRQRSHRDRDTRRRSHHHPGRLDHPRTADGTSSFPCFTERTMKIENRYCVPAAILAKRYAIFIHILGRQSTPFFAKCRRPQVLARDCKRAVLASASTVSSNPAACRTWEPVDLQCLCIPSRAPQKKTSSAFGRQNRLQTSNHVAGMGPENSLAGSPGSFGGSRTPLPLWPVAQFRLNRSAHRDRGKHTLRALPAGSVGSTRYCCTNSGGANAAGRFAGHARLRCRSARFRRNGCCNPSAWVTFRVAAIAATVGERSALAAKANHPLPGHRLLQPSQCLS